MTAISQDYLSRQAENAFHRGATFYSIEEISDLLNVSDIGSLGPFVTSPVDSKREPLRWAVRGFRASC